MELRKSSFPYWQNENLPTRLIITVTTPFEKDFFGAFWAAQFLERSLPLKPSPIVAEQAATRHAERSR